MASIIWEKPILNRIAENLGLTAAPDSEEQALWEKEQKGYDKAIKMATKAKLPQKVIDDIGKEKKAHGKKEPKAANISGSEVLRGLLIKAEEGGLLTLNGLDLEEMVHVYKKKKAEEGEEVVEEEEEQPEEEVPSE